MVLENKTKTTPWIIRSRGAGWQLDWLFFHKIGRTSNRHGLCSQIVVFVDLFVDHLPVWICCCGFKTGNNFGNPQRFLSVATSFHITDLGSWTNLLGCNTGCAHSNIWLYQIQEIWIFPCFGHLVHVSQVIWLILPEAAIEWLCWMKRCAKGKNQ